MNHPQPESQPTAPLQGGVLDRALALVEFLRAHCPWDAAQTSISLRRHLLEEAYETADAIDRGDPAAVRDELGDLLLNVAFQVVIGEENGSFDRAGVVAALEEKMQRRHPHLFGRGDAEPWEAIKAREREHATRHGGLLADVPAGADPLLRAQRLQERVARVGFDWPDAGGALGKVREETEEVAAALRAASQPEIEEEIGDLLFSVVNLARLAGAHAPAALSAANTKFSRRFSRLEELARKRDLVLGEISLEELDRLWEEAKRDERTRG